MRKKILELEKTASQLEPSPGQRKEWTRQVQAYAEDFLENIESLKAYNQTDHKGQELLNVPFPDDGRPLEDLLALLQRNVDRTGINPASGGHLGYIPGGGIYPTALGDYLAAVTNRYSGIFFANPGAVRIENELVRWMCSIAGYPASALGTLTSGGSIANLIAVVTARDEKKIRARDVENAVVYLTEQVHHCIHKALRIAGLGEAMVRYIPMDESYRMDAESLRNQVKLDIQSGLKPFLVVASAGTTDTGAIDPLEAIAEICEKHEIWMHVDAAYGGFFLLVEELKEKFKGIERSDSIAIDPHKGLFLSYGLGAVLMKNVAALQRSHYYRAAYMQDTVNTNEELSPGDLSPELTRHFRGLRMWLALQLNGLRPFIACLEEKHWLCRYFYEEIQRIGFETGPEPELSVCIYRYRPPAGDADEFNRRLIEYVHRDGRVFLSSTTIQGVFWLRLAVLSFRSHLRTIDLCLEVLQEGINHLSGSLSRP